MADSKGIQAMGIYCPPLWYPYPPPVHPSPQQMPSPPITPNTREGVAGEPLSAQDRPSPSTVGLSTPPVKEEELVDTQPPMLQQDHPGPRVVSIKFVDGEFKPEYHADDLQRWYESKGIDKRSASGQSTTRRDGEAEQGRTGEASQPNLVPLPVPFSPS
jgi:hypothetical protein